MVICENLHRKKRQKDRRKNISLTVAACFSDNIINHILGIIFLIFKITINFMNRIFKDLKVISEQFLNKLYILFSLQKVNNTS